MLFWSWSKSGWIFFFCGCSSLPLHVFFPTAPPPCFNFLLKNLYISFQVHNFLLCLMSVVLVFYFLNVHFTFHRWNKRLTCLSKSVATLKYIQAPFSEKTNYSCPYVTSFIFVFKIFLKQKTIKARITIVFICLASLLLLKNTMISKCLRNSPLPLLWDYNQGIKPLVVKQWRCSPRWAKTQSPLELESWALGHRDRKLWSSFPPGLPDQSLHLIEHFLGFLLGSLHLFFLLPGSH